MLCVRVVGLRLSERLQCFAEALRGRLLLKREVHAAPVLLILVALALYHDNGVKK